MFFKKLFSKNNIDKKDPKKENKEQTILILNQKIKEEELQLDNFKKKIVQLQEEAKIKLKEGDNERTKLILDKKKKLVECAFQIEKDLDKMEEEKVKL